MPSPPIAIHTLWPQHCLVIRSRVPRGMVAATIRESIDRIRQHASQAGGEMVGAPFARFPERHGPLVTVEAGLRLMLPIAGTNEIAASMLPGGRMAVAVHARPHALLPDTYAALENWLVAEGEVPAGTAWEVYVADPADPANAAKWRTEIFQPLR